MNLYTKPLFKRTLVYNPLLKFIPNLINSVFNV